MLKFGQNVGLTLHRGSNIIVPKAPRFQSAPLRIVREGNDFYIGGKFNVQCVKHDGTLRWEKEVKNGIVNQGLNKLLNVMFASATQITTWYCDLITTGATLAAADTYASHAGWSFDSHYGDATRRTWSPATSTAQSSTNASTMDFAINGTSTVYGVAILAGSSTKGDAASGSGVLWATGAFPGGEQSVVNLDTLKVTYTVNAAAS